MTELRATYQTEPYTAEPYAMQPNGDLPVRKRADLWRQLCAHLIGLATVFWWIAFKEAPPK